MAAGTPTASLSISKTASVSEITPGQTFVYTIQTQCTAGTVDGCVNAVLDDPLPSYLTIVGAPTISGTANYDTSGTTPTELKVVFTDDVGGQQGLAPGVIVTVQVTVKVDDNPPGTADGQTLTNTATVSADNATTKQYPADVVLTVPPTVSASTTKSISPDGGFNNTTDTTTATVTGTNTSNVPVDQLVISDPALDDNGNPPTADNPFSWLAVSSVGSVTYPANADTVVLRVYDSSTGTWVDGPAATAPATPGLPAGVDPANITGVQFVYTSSTHDGIQPGATAGFTADLHLKAVIPDAELPKIITNTADTTVTTTDGTSAKSDPASATYRVPPSNIDMSASKSFDPSVVHVGDQSTVTVKGTNNSGGTIESMTITEPANGTANHFTDGAWTYDSMGSVIWPAGATSASITYQCDGTDGAAQTTTTVDTLPAPPAGCDPVTGFSVTFTGTIENGATATIPFTITTNLDGQVQDELTRTNIVGVHGKNGPNEGDATDAATIKTIKDRIAVDVGKNIVQTDIPSYPGQIVVVDLNGRLLPFPDSTVDAKTIVVQDPDTIPDPNQWYASFNPKGVTGTAVPACSSLTVEYTADGTTWQPVSPELTDVHGATIVNEAFPDAVSTSAMGIRFVYTADPKGGDCSGGFPPGTGVSPNVVFGLDPSMNNKEATVTDCAASGATSPTAPDASSGKACDSVNLHPWDNGGGGGGIDPIDKKWDLQSVPERSQQQVGATLSWSTQGFTGLGRVDITDTDSPETTPIAQSMFDAWDLVRIDPITPSLDPHLTYDQVSKVQLFQNGAWIDAPNDPCPAACDGTFPGYTLSDADRAITTGFRLSYIESPTRDARIDGSAPPVGSGVTPSTGNDRKIHPVFELRDVRRSDPSQAVLARDTFNAGTAGIVTNTVGADPYWDADGTTPVFHYTDSDDIIIQPVDLTAQGTKTWTGGPLGIPEAGVAQADYPTSRVTVTASNTSVSKIDQLMITDADTSDQGGGTCTTNPFDQFNLKGFTTITAPGDIGATDVTITLLRSGGSTNYSRDQALALTEAQLVDVTKLTVLYTGRINAGSVSSPTTATVTFDVRLRETDRVTNQPPVPSTVCNQMRMDATDLVDFPDATKHQDDFKQADIDLVAQGIGVKAGKSFNPTTITEPSHGPADVTLSGQPSGPSRTVEMVLTDTTPTFFNQYDFTQFQPITWVNPVNQVKADVYVGGSWSLVAGQPVITGGHWVDGPTIAAPATALSLPAGVSASDVQGVRFTFTRTDGSNWENPENPTQTAVFQVTRRDTLHTGGPVPSDLVGSTPAPGETVAGDATNTTTASVTSSDKNADGPLTADSDPAKAVIHYQHATNAVQIRKSPEGSAASPNVPFTYTITTKNTGNVDITNPVITDVFPSDAQGPQIQLVQDPGYTFAITGGTGMPTDPANVTINASATGVVFTFPNGSTLPIGATYTITFKVVTRAGLPAGTLFTNTVGITGDRVWDQCDGGEGSGRGLDPETGQCRTNATNTVNAAGAVTIVKGVKAEGSDTLGVVVDPLFNPNIPVTCVPSAAGFYVRPCVPIAQPGGHITWRLHFVNAGNLALDRILGIDRLPAPGDTVATAPDLARLSDWQPLLSGVRPDLVLPGGTLNVYFTTGSAWCDGPAGANGQLLCPAMNWQAWPVGATLASLGVAPASVTGIQVEYLPTTPLVPAGSFDVDVPMLAPAYSPADTPNTTAMTDADTYAFNSAGTSARVQQSGQYTLTTEPPRVGVGLAHGGLKVEKLVTGPAADQFAPKQFPVTLSCTSAGQPVPLPADVANLTLTPDTPVTIYDLPYHATCTLTEGDNGQTSSTSTTATVQLEQTTFETATLTNDYQYASLAVKKAVDSQAVNQDGEPIVYGPFTVSVTCTYLGKQVYADGYGPLHPMTADLSDGQTVTFTKLPAGASCTIAETDAAGAASSTITTTVAGGKPTDATTIAVGPTTAGTNTALVTNTFQDGPLVILKKVTGTAADTYGAGPFTMHVICTLETATPHTVWDGTVTLGGGAPLSAEIVHIAAGASCVTTETDDGGATTTTISPTDPVVIGSGEQPVTVTVTNEFDPAKILVDKKVDGDAASFAPDSFPITVTCVANGEDLPGFPVTVDVTPGTPVEIDTLAGAHCFAVETDTGMATTVTYDPANPLIGGGSGPVFPTTDRTPTITVTNTYDAGALQIVKQIQGTGASTANGPFVFSVVCSFNGDAKAYTDTVTLKRTGTSNTLMSDLIAPLPVGADCTVTETQNGGADSTPAPVTVTIKASEVEHAAVASFVNTFTAPLPVTGGTGASWWVVGGAGILIVLGLVILLVWRRRKPDES